MIEEEYKNFIKEEINNPKEVENIMIKGLGHIVEFYERRGDIIHEVIEKVFMDNKINWKELNKNINVEKFIQKLNEEFIDEKKTKKIQYEMIKEELNNILLSLNEMNAKYSEIKKNDKTDLQTTKTVDVEKKSLRETLGDIFKKLRGDRDYNYIVIFKEKDINGFIKTINEKWAYCIIDSFIGCRNFLYEKIKQKSKNYIKIVFNSNKIEESINNGSEIRIFGEKFINNNSERCVLLKSSKNSEYKTYRLTDLTSYKIEENNSKEFIEIIFINMSGITDMSYMFSGCSEIQELNLNNFDTSKVTNMSSLFYGCESLIKIPDDISDWNTSNVTDMNNMFYKCKTIISLPDISKWNTSNVTDMSCMFSDCYLLNKMPNLEIWDIKKVVNYHDIFHYSPMVQGKPKLDFVKRKNNA